MLSTPPTWMSIVSPKIFIAMAEHSKCHPGRPGPKGLGQYIMAKTGGLREKQLVLILLLLELIGALVAIRLFAVL